MSAPDFHDVLQIAKNAFLSELQKYPPESCRTEIVIDNAACFRAIVEWKKCIGEILIEKAEYAPYRYVSFRILDITENEEKSVFCYYDSKETLEEIKDKIKDGFKTAYDYDKSAL